MLSFSLDLFGKEIYKFRVKRLNGLAQLVQIDIKEKWI